MRRGQIIFLSFILLLALPVGAAADKPAAADKASVAAVVDPARAVGVTDTHVTLTGRIVPGVTETTAFFEYGPTTDYGSTAAASPAKLPAIGVTASASIDGLAPSTTYHFRLVLVLADATVPGPDGTFTTSAPAAAQSETENGQGRSEDVRKDDKGHNGHDDDPAPVVAPEAPVLGKSVAVGPKDGTVRVREARSGRFVELTEGTNIPPGSEIDATFGTVSLTSALDKRGNVQTGEFSGGRFLVRQSKSGDGMVDIYLQGSIGRCTAGTARLASAPSKKPGRRLWGKDHDGKFRTHGKNSVAAVRGTRWLTEDTCAGTRTRVTEGAVSVRDLTRQRTVSVRAGQSYLARPAR